MTEIPYLDGALQRWADYLSLNVEQDFSPRSGSGTEVLLGNDVKSAFADSRF